MAIAGPDDSEQPKTQVPQQVVELGHVLRQGMRGHRGQMGVDRRAAGQAAVSRVDLALRRVAGVQVDGLPAQGQSVGNTLALITSKVEQTSPHYG